jgi:hypothetical protein
MIHIIPKNSGIAETNGDPSESCRSEHHGYSNEIERESVAICSPSLLNQPFQVKYTRIPKE